jgi:DNA-binding transcriptional regulator YdaS (Cro superfamily)
MDNEPTPFQALEQAAEVAGGQSGLARICGVTQPSVWKWLQSSKRLPAEYVLRVEAATGISRHYLRPDIYPLELPAITKLPTWKGVDSGASRVSFHNEGALHGAASR